MSKFLYLRRTDSSLALHPGSPAVEGTGPRNSITANFCTEILARHYTLYPGYCVSKLNEKIRGWGEVSQIEAAPRSESNASNDTHRT